MRTLGAVLLLLTLRADALSFGPERTVTRPYYGPTIDYAEGHAIASDGTKFLVVWWDRTAGREGIYATMMDDRGVVAPSPSRALVRGQFLSSVLVAWAGDAYQLVWYDSGAQAAMAARVSRDGELLAQPYPFAPAPACSIAFNGTRTLVLFIENAAVTGVLLGRDRVERDRFPIAASTPAAFASAVAVGPAFVVTWGEMLNGETGVRSNVRAVRVSGDGGVGTPAAIVENLGVSIASINTASDGTRVGVVFAAGVFLSQSIRRYTLDAETLTAVEHERIFTGTFERQVIVTPEGFAAAYLSSDTGELVLTIAPFSSTERRAIALGPNRGIDLRLAAADHAVGAVWRNELPSPLNRPHSWTLAGATLDANATRRTNAVVPVAVSAVRQLGPVVAPAGDDALVVWRDEESSIGSNVMAMRVGASGAALDAQPLLVATDVLDARPHAVFTGAVWIVTWDDGGSTFFRRISRNGVFLDESAIRLGDRYGSSLASNGDVTVTIVGTSLLRFSRDGELIGATLTVEHGGEIASNGREFLVVWEEGSNWWQFPSADLRDIRALRLDASGVPIDAVPIDVAVGPADTGAPHVASDGADFLVVYERANRDELRSYVHAKRVLRNGTLDGVTAQQDGVLVVADAFANAVASVQGGYAVLFSRIGTAIPPAIWTVPVDVRGAVTDRPLLLAKADADFEGATIASSASQTWTAYAKTAPAPELDNAVRVFVRTLQSDSDPPRRRSARP